jgi:antirestriction protein ArdC
LVNDKLEAEKNRRVQIEFSPIDEAEKIISGYKNCPKIVNSGDRACYVPSEDEINMPKQDTFVSSEYYYQVLFHEAVHSTGHKSRLCRVGVTSAAAFGDDIYSQEELVAEFGASFLSGFAGINSEKMLDNSAAYIQGWKKYIREDKKGVVFAASSAQKACDHILGQA